VGRQTPEAIATIFSVCYNLGFISFANLVLIGKGILIGQTPKNWPLPLKAYIAHIAFRCHAAM
jgi:hypothetical protein